jgi:hypothetical protein
MAAIAAEPLSTASAMSLVGIASKMRSLLAQSGKRAKNYFQVAGTSAMPLADFWISD